MTTPLERRAGVVGPDSPQSRRAPIETTTTHRARPSAARRALARQAVLSFVTSDEVDSTAGDSEGVIDTAASTVNSWAGPCSSLNYNWRSTEQEKNLLASTLRAVVRSSSQLALFSRASDAFFAGSVVNA